MLAFTEREKKVTNHSVRKTCISRLLDADVPENFVAQLSGHKSTESLQSYKSTSANHQKRMSLTLSRTDVSGSRDEALSSVHNGWFEVVTRSTTDCKFDNYIDWSVKRSVTFFHHSNFYRCKHRMWKLSRMKGSVRLLSLATRTIDFEAIFYQLCPVLNYRNFWQITRG